MNPARRRRRMALFSLGLLWVALTAIAQNPDGRESLQWAAGRAVDGTKAIDPFFLCQRFFGGMKGDYDREIYPKPPPIERPPQGPALALTAMFKGGYAVILGVRRAGWPAFLPAVVSLLPGTLLAGMILSATLGPNPKKPGDEGLYATIGWVMVTFLFLSLMLVIGGTIALVLKWTLWGVFSALGAAAALVVYVSPLIAAIEWIRGLIETSQKVRELASLAASGDTPDPPMAPAEGGGSLEGGTAGQPGTKETPSEAPGGPSPRLPS